jgi:hypothetical protein
MPNYSANDPKGWCGDPKRGAALGRPTVKDVNRHDPIELSVQRVHLDAGGYDRNGTYFGRSEGSDPLYWVASEDGQVDYCLRAKDLESARALVSRDFTDVTFVADAPIGETVDKYDPFFAAYVECALWSSTDDNGDPLDNGRDIDDVADTSLASMWSECRDFRMGEASTDLVGMDPTQAGHDFWLTRNRHGAGFWDRGLGERGKRLTDAAHAHGSCDLYVGDDGKVWVL